MLFMNLLRRMRWRGRCPKCGALINTRAAPRPAGDAGRSPPDINDMFVAGLQLRQAVAIEREIAAHPEVSADYWWKLVKSFAPSAQGTC